MGIRLFFVIISFFVVETTFSSINVTLGRILDKPMVFLYCLVFLTLFYGGLEKLKNKRTAGVLLAGITSFIAAANYVTMRFNNKFFAFSDIAYFGDKKEVLLMFISKLYSPLLVVVGLSSFLYVTLALLYKEELAFDKIVKLPEIDDKYFCVSFEKLVPIVFENEEEWVAKKESKIEEIEKLDKTAVDFGSFEKTGDKEDFISVELPNSKRIKLDNNINRRIDFMEEVERITDEIERIVENVDNAVEEVTGKNREPLFSSKRWGICILAMMIVLSQFIFSFDRFYFSNLINTYKFINFDTGTREIYESFDVPFSEYSRSKADIVYEDIHRDVDVVVIQSEAFFDFQKLSSLGFSKNITQNFRRYQKEGMWGRSFVPVIGGMTCNSEFEFLTGMRVKDMNGYQIPFEEAPLMEVNSLARDFKNYGFETKAVHGYRRDFFQRDKVYPMLGIDEFIAEDDFVDANYYGAWMSDKDIFNRILEELEDGKANDKNQFIFSVTVQNHGPFSYKAPKDVVSVQNLPNEDQNSLENYAAGLKISDESLGDFMEAISQREKETIVVFYGDHIFSSEHRIIATEQYFTANANNKYATDYFMWSNKGSIESEKKDQSLLGLSRELKKQVLPLTYFDSFVLENYDSEEYYFEGMDSALHEAYKTVINRAYTNSQQKFDPLYFPKYGILND